MGTDETQRLVRPLVIPPPMLPCATAPPHSPWSSRVATNRCVPGGIEALQQSSAPRQQCSGAALHTALAVAWGVALGARALGWHSKRL